MAVAFRKKVDQPGVDILQFDAQALDGFDVAPQGLKINQHGRGLVAAAIAGGFFQHRPQVGLRRHNAAASGQHRGHNGPQDGQRRVGFFNRKVAFGHVSCL